MWILGIAKNANILRLISFLSVNYMITMSAQNIIPISSYYSREEILDEMRDFDSLPLPDEIIELKEKIPLESILKAAVQSSPFFKLVKLWNLPFHAYSNVSLLSLPPHIENLLKPLVHEIHHRERSRKKKSSPCDCYLGFLARIYGMEVISYDTDIYHSLNQILQFEAKWPFDVVRGKAHGAFLVDTNVLIHLLNRHQTHFSEIVALFEKEGIELIIPDFVMEEYWNCMKKESTFNNKKKTRKKSGKKSSKKTRKNPKKSSIIDDD